MTHTRTPWAIDSMEIIGIDEDGDECTICVMTPEDEDFPTENDFANAEHIVKCVNSHDALKSALIKINAWAFTNAYPEIEEVCEQALKAAGETV